MARRIERDDAGQKFLAFLDAFHARIGCQRLDIEFGQRIEARRLGGGPGDFLRADPNRGAIEQYEIDRMIVMGVGQDDIGNIFRRIRRPP